MTGNRGRAWVRLAGGAALLGALVAGLGVTPGSAAHLEVDGGVLQVFEFDGPADEMGALGDCGDLSEYDDVVHGTPGDDVIRGGNHAQVIVGHGGDDILSGGNQHDCLLGGTGDDALYGGNGVDILVGGAGTNTLDGGNGKDLVDGVPE